MANFNSVRVADSVAVLGDVTGGLRFHLQILDASVVPAFMKLLPTGAVPQSSRCYTEDISIEEFCQRFLHLRLIQPMQDPDCYHGVYRFMANVDAYTAQSRLEQWNLEVDVPLGNIMRRFQVYYGGERISPAGQELSQCRKFLTRESIQLGPPSINLLIDLFIFLLPDFFPHPEYIRKLIYQFLVGRSTCQMGAYHPLTLILKQLQLSFASSDDFMQFVPMNALLNSLMDSIPDASANSDMLIVRDNVYVLVGSLLECYGHHKERLDLLQSNLDSAIRTYGKEAHTTNLARLNLAFALRIQGQFELARKMASEARHTFVCMRQNEHLRACATELLGRLACDEGDYETALYYWKDSIDWHMILDSTWRCPRLARQFQNLSISIGEMSKLTEMKFRYPTFFAEVDGIDEELCEVHGSEQ